MIVNSTELRRVLGCFATGVTIVTCRVGERAHGITVNSFSSVSLDPPLVLICIDQRTIAYDLLPKAGAFVVNILNERQRDISDFFAKRLAVDPNNEFAEIPYRNGLTGAPIIEGAIAVIECRIVNRYPAGDHDIFVAEVLSADILSDDVPLLFHRGRYPKLVP
jgi:flavin reductase (DIM6/NTAB) family NADH-FMN oxidoreductase RutF